MARVTLTSQVATLTSQVADLQRELELTKRQLADALTEKGALLSQLASQEQDIPHHFQESYATLTDERNALIAENQRLVESCVAAHERCDALEAIVAKSMPQPQRQAAASKPLPSPAVVESASTIEITDLDRAMWRKFQALPREQRLAIIEFARPEWGHVGIHNITEVRAAWRAANPISA